jgi:tRNA threonylcarbamoyladenosine biosynthesis protein TsaE
LNYAGDDKIWIFKGEMGAGKTTLIKSIAKSLGVQDGVSSPTFSIVNEYQSVTEGVVYHFDFYRIDDPREALEIGVEEYFYSGKICLIEWAEKVAQFLPEKFFFISIEPETKSRRKISLLHSYDAL